MVSTELPRKIFKDRMLVKQEAFVARQKVKKVQFGERSLKKTNISYAESQKCKKLTEFGVIKNDGSKNKRKLEK